jgi:DNA primase
MFIRVGVVVGMSEMNIFEMLRERVDLAELASRYTDLKPSRRTLVGCCPHPEHDDEHPSFHVYPEGRFFCYGCRWHGKSLTCGPP